jgi:hypothetical protein
MKLIIARYKEDTTWAHGLDHFIVQKDEHLPNLGREASSYLWYVREHYGTLNGDYLFCQGHPFDHDGDFLVHKDNERYFGGWHECDEFGHPHTFAALPMNATLLKLGLPRYERFRFRAGAQFRLSADEIRLYPRTFYEQAYEISMTEELAPWTFERLWPYIFPHLILLLAA